MNELNDSVAVATGAFENMARNNAPMLCRSFAAVEVSEILGQWRWDGGFSNQEIAAALAPMRARSREMVPRCSLKTSLCA